MRQTRPVNAASSLRLAVPSIFLALGLFTLALPLLFGWLMSDPERRSWVLSQPGMAGMGRGPNQLWALVACLLTAALLLGLGLSLPRRR